MHLDKIIDRARALARRFQEAGHEEVRLPVFSYDDWRMVYDQPNSGQSLAEWRKQTKQNWYLIHFLRQMDITVDPVPVRGDEFAAWSADKDHELTDGHQLAHAVGEYVNDPAIPVSQCRHASLDPAFDGLGGQATITVYGESEDRPELMSVVQHGSDGEVMQSLQILALDHTPEQAWQEAQRFLARVRPGNVFHDQTVRQPEYCADCNGLLVSVASPEEIKGRQAD